MCIHTYIHTKTPLDLPVKRQNVQRATGAAMLRSPRCGRDNPLSPLFLFCQF